jgi:acetyltransferase-like isoleucine patch superfamily enzyme
MHENAMIYPNVTLGQEVVVGVFTIVGEPPQGCQPGELATTIGDRAILRSHTVIYAGNRLGSNFQTGHGALLRELNQVGDNVSIGSHSVVEHHIEIGNNVRIHSNVFIPEFSILEENCWIGPCVVLTNARYPRSPHVKEQLRGPRVGQSAKIGAGAILLPGVTIGSHALVGAGAIVTHDVPEGGVVVGNPARVTKSLDALTAYHHST